MNKSGAIKMFHCSYDVEYTPIIYDNINGQQYKFGVYSVHEQLGEGGEFSSKGSAYDDAVRRGFLSPKTLKSFLTESRLRENQDCHAPDFLQSCWLNVELWNSQKILQKSGKNLKMRLKNLVLCFTSLKPKLMCQSLCKLAHQSIT